MPATTKASAISPTPPSSPKSILEFLLHPHLLHYRKVMMTSLCVFYKKSFNKKSFRSLLTKSLYEVFDDMQIRVFNYNTLERVHMFEAHSDYIRCIAVHPTQPFILTSSDDMLIKLWDWEKKWSCSQIFEGHTHYVMQIVINPKDNNQFASASLDRTIKVWQLGSSTPNFTLEGHEKGGRGCAPVYSQAGTLFVQQIADLGRMTG
uniref:Uncharacterized protein n=1 Tax=Eptatretus burgeri TaxID=7764 RepID=A0A8C4Q5M1_EPTBU